MIGELHMLVKDIMTKEVVTVKEEDTVETCAKMMSTHNLSGIPVVDSSGYMKGIITEGDLIKRKAKVPTPAYLEFLGGIIYLDNPNKFFDEVKKSMGLFVKEVMTEDIITVMSHDTIEEAVNLLVNKKIKRLPVVNDDGKLVGIVSRRDIMEYIFENELN